MELRGHDETQQCHLCPATFAPPHGRKTLFRHMRNIHGIIPETKRSHLIGRSLKKTEEPKAPEDILEEVLALGLEPEEPKEPEVPSEELARAGEYIYYVFDGILFDQCINRKGCFYEDYIAEDEEKVEELTEKVEELKELNKEIKKEVSALEEVRDIQENKIMELTETIIDKDRIIEELRKQLEEAKKVKEPEPVPEEPKEPIVINKSKIDKSKIKVKTK